MEILQTDYEEDALEERIGMYRFPFGKCQPGPGLLAYYDTLDFSECESSYEKCISLMHRLYQDFQYVPNATEVYTPAEEAWSMGKGVCQDYAHIYITLLRLAGIPARYVGGILFTIRDYPIVDEGSLMGRLLRKEACLVKADRWK